MTTGKLGKCFSEFMIHIILLKELAVKNLIRLLKSLTCEDDKGNKLPNAAPVF